MLNFDIYTLYSLINNRSNKSSISRKRLFDVHMVDIITFYCFDTIKEIKTDVKFQHNKNQYEGYKIYCYGGQILKFGVCRKSYSYSFRNKILCKDKYGINNTITDFKNSKILNVEIIRGNEQRYNDLTHELFYYFHYGSVIVSVNTTKGIIFMGTCIVYDFHVYYCLVYRDRKEYDEIKISMNHIIV